MAKFAATALLLACAIWACTGQVVPSPSGGASDPADADADYPADADYYDYSLSMSSQPAKQVSGLVVSVAPKGGRGERPKGLSSYDISCPSANAFITGLNVRQGTILAKRKVDRDIGDSKVPIDIIEAIAPVFCSDGGVASTKVPELPSGARRLWWHPKSPTGYKGLKLRVGDVIDAVSVIEERVVDGYFGGSGGEPDKVECPTGYLMVGLYGEATRDHIVTLGLRCRKVEG